MAYIVAGLGNPQSEYAGTRHNSGRQCVQALAKKFETPAWKLDKKLQALTTQVIIGKKKILLVLPENYMNNSGASLKPLVKSTKAASELVVIYDDLDLPLGRVRLSFDRGSGGHKGVESIIKKIGTRAFVRIRIGVCPVTSGGKMRKPTSEESVLRHILGKFSAREQEQLNKVNKKISQALEIFWEQGRERATSFLNA